MLREYYKRVLSIYGYSERPYLSYVIDNIEDYWDKKILFVVEAPTGYGKSTVSATMALRAYEEGRKLVIGYPLRTLLEDQFRKLTDAIKDTEMIGKRYMHVHDSLYLIKPITLTTIDTLSLTMFGLAPEDLNIVLKNWYEWIGTLQGSSGHYLFSWSSIILSDIILDEVHLLADEAKSLTFLVTMIEHAYNHDQKIIFMSATLPAALKEKIKSSSRIGDKIHWIDFQDDKEFINSRREKKYELKVEALLGVDKYEKMFSWIEDAFNRGYSRVIVIFNTVRDAINFYNLYTSRNGHNHAILLHSRLNDNDRRRKIDRLNQLRSGRKYVVIATQVIEAGVDMTSDVLISELAPANSLVQRFGRFLRYKDEVDGCAYIWYDASLINSKNYKVYDGNLCHKTKEYLEKNRGNINLHVPNDAGGYSHLINYVYSIENFVVNRRLKEEFLLTFTNPDNIASVVSKFLDLEGSFVRDAELIPVMPASINESIPISYRLFLRLLDKGIVTSVILNDGSEKEINKSKLKSFKNALKYMIRENVIAFRINCYYDEELGLIIPEDGNYE